MESNMQLRETKISPLSDDQWLVEMIYADDPDLTKAKNLLHIRRTHPAKPKHRVAMYQREIVGDLVDWIHDEVERLREQIL
jgi:hypothetical protein